ncbi:MAG: FkbM family methyltransferase [Rhodomicrobium sp.]
MTESSPPNSGTRCIPEKMAAEPAAKTSVRVGREIQRFRKRLTKYANLIAKGHPDAYLKGAKGVIHVGANVGQERHLYGQHDIRVIWIEPIPSVYEILKRNISSYPKQHAIKALITDREGASHTLHIANNNGASSSIYEMHQCKDIWPQVTYVGELTLTSSTLPSIVARHNIDLNDYDILIMDTQGTELDILIGSTEILPHFNYIKTEAADFEAYKHCGRLSEIEAYLYDHNFALARQDKIAEHPEGGAYYDVLFKRGVT